MRTTLVTHVLVALASHAYAAPSLNDPFDSFSQEFKRNSPTVATDYGTWVGSSSSGVDSFKGIPYAQPPLGNLRFAAPKPPNTTYGTFSAQNWGNSCVQYTAPPAVLPPGFLGETLLLYSQLLGFGSEPIVGKEDCLNLNVFRPSGVKGPLPVLFWIYGGAFAVGTSSGYDGTSIVKKSVEIGQPVIFVSVNYRLNGFGFLPGRQVKPGGGHINAGLLDQRLGMKWVQKYIHLFGGNPKQVTIFGESAGAISVGYHLVANNGNNEGLFHAAIMESGSPLPTVGAEGGQDTYDQIASVSGCDKADDSFKCLQQLPVDTLKDAIDTLPTLTAYNGLHLATTPRVDGTFLTADGMDLLQQGKYVKVPVITGNCYDEGTYLGLGGFNATTTDDVRLWLKKIFTNIKDNEVDKLLELYPDDPSVGSPYDTWLYNNVSGQNKRVASLTGDLIMQGPRRFLIDYMRKTQNVWSYQTRALISTPIFGSFHGSEVIHVFDLLPWNPRLTDEMQSRWVSFAATFNPNPKSKKFVNWPVYGKSKKQLQFADFGTTVEIDDFRQNGTDYILSIRKALAI